MRRRTLRGRVTPLQSFKPWAVFRAGLACYTKLFANKYAARGMRMTNLLPGFIDSLAEKPDRVARIQAGRYAKVRELSGTVAFFLGCIQLHHGPKHSR